VSHRLHLATANSGEFPADDFDMRKPSLPVLSRSLLDELRGRMGPYIEAPPAKLLSAPETILQIGSGAFLRGFVEDFVQLANVAGNLAGRVLSVQRQPDHRSEAFIRQEGLYTLILRGIENGETKEKKRIIASIGRCLSAETDWNDVIAMASQPSTRVIVSNVTESGLVFAGSDAPNDQPPLSFPGKLTQLLRERWRKSGGQNADLAVIPCELIENNGSVLRSLIEEQAQAWNLPVAFSNWLGSSVHFANTLVDRIVAGPPAPDKLEAEWQALGYRDDLIICAEPFVLFALEADEFVRKHFPVDKASPGIRFVDDLTPYRVRKVQILNGSHTVLAAIGRLLGLETVRDAIDDPQLGSFIERTIFQEVMPGTELDGEEECGEYSRETLARFHNPSIEHLLVSICSNCSTKVGTRLFPTIRRFMERRGVLPQKLLFGVAAGMLLLRDSDVEDSHLALIRGMWAQVDYQSSDSVLTLVQNILDKQIEWSREQIDVRVIAPDVAGFLMKVHAQGLRPTMDACFGGIVSEC
jgi:tagaturonate reductase